MTQDNSYQRPSLFLNGKEVLSDISGSVTFTGNNQLNTLSVKINNPDLQNTSIYNKILELYLNNGADDGVPIFRGYINDFTPNDKDISLFATDMRAKLTGRKGLKLTLTDKNNYDGYTLGQFIFSYINEFIDDTDIGTDFLTDTSPVVFMTGERGEDKDFYSLLVKKVQEAIDVETDVENPLGYFIDIVNGSNSSNIVIKKDKLLTSNPSAVFSFADGLVSYSYKRRLPPNTVTYEGRKFSYTNVPQGVSSISLPKQNSPAESKNFALQKILLEQQQTDEISIQISKNYDIDIGQIVSLDIDDEDISGNHRVQGKTINFGNSTSCSLKLNKKPPILKDYIS
tara:strand:+ start:786 stop:1808 length:1023 start_codon:yes stop_codon:yes gene_type:complete